MLISLLWIAVASGAPFWETKPPAQWSEEDLERLLTDSPWAQVVASAAEQSDGVEIYLATARPVQEGEQELRRRRPPKDASEASDEEYREFLRGNQGKVIVLAVRLPRWDALADASEARRMEEESVMKVGRKKFQMTGHFPPAPSDPWVRLVYPRAVSPSDKSVVFELYLPSVPQRYRQVEFRLKDLLYKGAPEM